MRIGLAGLRNGPIICPMKRYSVAVLAGLSISFVLTDAASAAPAGVALVVGNAAYTGLPPLPGCALSAHAVAAALKEQGYDVLERPDASTGQLDAAIGALAEKLAATPHVPAMIHFCGYVAGLSGRYFLVPISAALTRPSDILTQGLLAKSLVDAAQTGERDALVVLEAVPLPTSAEPLALETLDRPGMPARLSILAVTETGGASPTPLSTAMMPRFRVTPLKVSQLIDGIVQDLAGQRTATVALRRTSAEAGYLFGGPPPPKPLPPPMVVAAPVTPPPPPSPVTVAPVAPPPTPVAPVPAALPPPAAIPAPAYSGPQLPDETVMTDAERRTVQTMLAKLGYYPGPVDGIFGSDTRAAIRRLQFEVHAPMDGHLTAELARRLMAPR
jgi:hypothetical protein